MGTNPAEALEAIREGLDSLGILLSVEPEDDEVVKYVIQFQLSSQLQMGVKFIMSRILENLHAVEAASYYKVIGEMGKAEELMDLGRLALATAFASEAQVFAKQSEQGALRAQIERNNAFIKLADELSEFEDEDGLDEVIQAHDKTLLKIKQAVVSFESAAHELASVKLESIRQKNNVDGQVKQLQGVVMKFRGDLLRMEGAKSDFLAEYLYRKGEKTKAKKHYSKASDQLREAVGNYNYAAQVFQQLGDTQAAQNVETKAKTTDLLARGVWDNKQRLGRDQDPALKQDAELAILYLGGAGQ
jgi:tetratricopeptide (TPR) repeat protein